MCWAADNPELLALMEKGRLLVLRGEEAEEPVPSTACLAAFSDLQVRARWQRCFRRGGSGGCASLAAAQQRLDVRGSHALHAPAARPAWLPPHLLHRCVACSWMTSCSSQTCQSST